MYIWSKKKENLLQHDEFYRIYTKRHEMSPKKQSIVSLCTLEDKRLLQ